VYPFEVLLQKAIVTDTHASILMPQQIRTISRTRLLETLGAITDASTRAKIETRLLQHLRSAVEAEAAD